jgi:hypothetical protein
MASAFAGVGGGGDGMGGEGGSGGGEGHAKLSSVEAAAVLPVTLRGEGMGPHSALLLVR